MPEGPEVKRTTERLNRLLQGKELQEIFVEDLPWFGKQVRDDIMVLMSHLNNEPITIDSVQCKGKFIYFTLGDYHIHHTLGMTGTWRLPGKGDKKHRRMVLKMTDGTEITYVDYRKFGTFKIFHDNPQRLVDKLQTLGPDMLNNTPDISVWVDRMRGSHTRKGYGHKEITQVMMDQKVVTGIGNYIKAEALYMAEIHPNAIVSQLTDDDLTRLYEATVWVIKASYEARGATIRNYKLPNGDIGDYKFKFKVYAQKRDPLGYQVKKMETADKRKTHWVPEVQTRGLSTQTTL
jgi:formamidopyrimidine-DNA glycosylase